MIVSACLHISVIDRPNLKHSPLSTSCDGTLDWNHSGWGGVWAICYLLPARFQTTPPPTLPLLLNPLPTPPPYQPPTLTRPLLPEFLPQEHIMVIRQYVCIGINQQRSQHKNYDTEKSVCNFWWMGRSPLFVWMDGEAGQPVGPVQGWCWGLCTWGTSCILSYHTQGFLDNVRQAAWRWWMPSKIRLISITATLAPPLPLSLPCSAIPAILLPAWFIKLLWQFTLMLFPAT